VSIIVGVEVADFAVGTPAVKPVKKLDESIHGRGAYRIESSTRSLLCLRHVNHRGYEAEKLLVPDDSSCFYSAAL